MNEKTREKEREENEARRDKQDDEREQRVKALAEKLKGDGFKTYHLTLDNVDKPELVLESQFTREQSTGMRVATKEDGDSGSDMDRFPYGLEPVKLETVNIMRDLIELSSHQPTTARAEEKPKS